MGAPGCGIFQRFSYRYFRRRSFGTSALLAPSTPNNPRRRSIATSTPDTPASSTPNNPRWQKMSIASPANDSHKPPRALGGQTPYYARRRRNFPRNLGEPFAGGCDACNAGARSPTACLTPPPPGRDTQTIPGNLFSWVGLKGKALLPEPDTGAIETAPAMPGRPPYPIGEVSAAAAAGPFSAASAASRRASSA